MKLDEQSIKIVGLMGFDVHIKNEYHSYTSFEISHRASGASITLQDFDAQHLLDFLITVQLTGGETLKSQVRALEDQVKELKEMTPSQPPKEQCDQPTLEELRVRAAVIGTGIAKREGPYYYLRPRFMFPGTKAFCFTVSNALEPKRKHFSYGGMNYEFEEHEYPILVKWIEHDEKIYAELNQKYNTNTN